MTKPEKSKKKSWKTVVRRVLLVLCGAIVGINVYLANARSLAGNQLPMPFGYGAAIVLTGSMEPTISAGDLIVVHKEPVIAVDDIVVYQSSGSLVVHRVIALADGTVTTQGDANNAADAPVERSAIQGKVLFHLPKVGSVVSLIKSPVATVCIIVAAIALVEIPHRKGKERDDAERQKIIDEIRRLKDEE